MRERERRKSSQGIVERGKDYGMRICTLRTNQQIKYIYEYRMCGLQAVFVCFQLKHVRWDNSCVVMYFIILFSLLLELVLLRILEVLLVDSTVWIRVTIWILVGIWVVQFLVLLWRQAVSMSAVNVEAVVNTLLKL